MAGAGSVIMPAAAAATVRPAAAWSPLRLGDWGPPRAGHLQPSRENGKGQTAAEGWLKMVRTGPASS